jgi:hypothetical protein
MDTITLKEDLPIFGLPVKNFPEGIGETFDKLVSLVPGGFSRPYYGISKMTDKGMHYMAAALEISKSEAEQCHCERATIEHGEYLAETVKDWRSKTDSINGVFHTLLQDPKADNTKPCVEWYKNDQEMVCMVKTRS